MVGGREDNYEIQEPRATPRLHKALLILGGLYEQVWSYMHLSSYC